MKCEACGKSILFCPYCGEKLSVHQQQPCASYPVKQAEECVSAVTDNAVCEAVPQKSEVAINDIEDVVRHYEHFIAEQRDKGVSEAEYRPEAEILLKKLKSQLQDKVKIAPKAKFHVADKFQEDKENFDDVSYSLLLKGSPNADSLAYRLDKVLMRDYRAIQLTVERMPCIAVYKGRMEDIVRVVRAFYQEKAAITVITGELQETEQKTFEQLYPAFDGLGSKVKQLILAAPITLWQGDQVYSVVYAQNNERGGGALVVTDQALYFLDRGKTEEECHFTVIPYYRVSEVTSVKDAAKSSVVIHYRDSVIQEVFDIADPQKFEMAQQDIQRALQQGNWRLFVKTYCKQCKTSLQEDIAMADIREDCASCGQTLERRLVF